MNSPFFYVDDDTDDLEIFAMAAKSLFIDVELFDNGSEMIQALLNPPPTPAIIFIDINMPMMPGYEVIKTIKEIRELVHIPLIVWTTTDDANTIAKCKILGADYFIQKPTSLSYLTHTLSHVAAMDWTIHDPCTHFKHQHTL